MAENENENENAEETPDEKLRGSDYVNNDGIVVRVRDASGKPIHKSRD